MDQMEDDDTDREECPDCAGEGFVFGYELDDPLWYEPDDVYPCENCGGSGLLKDCTVF